jgi:nicotinamidase-related amidase
MIQFGAARKLGVWTAHRCASVLIDYQKEMLEAIRSDTSAEQVELNAQLLAKAATAFDMPIVLSTVGVGLSLYGPTLASILDELDGIEPIDRTSMNAFEDYAFHEQLKAVMRGRLIMVGLHTETSLSFATVEALKADHEVMFVTDAVGGRSQAAHRTAIERLSHAGALPTTTLAVVSELFRDWASPLAGPASDVIDWYSTEVSKLTDNEDIAIAEHVTAVFHGED